MALDTLLHRNLMGAIEKTYQEAIDLIEKFGYSQQGSIPEDAPRKQLEAGLVIVPGLPTMVFPTFGPLGSRIPPEEVLEELLSRLNENVVVPDEEKEKLKGTLRAFIEKASKMREEYEKLEKKAVHPIISSIMRETRRNEEQHEAVLKKLTS
jgi:hypothetical protein